jgi:hypothetical protein
MRLVVGYEIVEQKVLCLDFIVWNVLQLSFQFEVGEVAAIILVSTILTLLVDLPFQEIKKILWREGKHFLSNVFATYL